MKLFKDAMNLGFLPGVLLVFEIQEMRVIILVLISILSSELLVLRVVFEPFWFHTSSLVFGCSYVLGISSVSRVCFLTVPFPRFFTFIHSLKFLSLRLLVSVFVFYLFFYFGSHLSPVFCTQLHIPCIILIYFTCPLFPQLCLIPLISPQCVHQCIYCSANTSFFFLVSLLLSRPVCFYRQTCEFCVALAFGFYFLASLIKWPSLC